MLTDEQIAEKKARLEKLDRQIDVAHGNRAVLLMAHESKIRKKLWEHFEAQAKEAYIALSILGFNLEGDDTKEEFNARLIEWAHNVISEREGSKL